MDKEPLPERIGAWYVDSDGDAWIRTGPTLLTRVGDQAASQRRDDVMPLRDVEEMETPEERAERIWGDPDQQHDERAEGND